MSEWPQRGTSTMAVGPVTRRAATAAAAAAASLVSADLVDLTGATPQASAPERVPRTNRGSARLLLQPKGAPPPREQEPLEPPPPPPSGLWRRPSRRALEVDENSAIVKRKRGRAPRKHPIVEPVVTSDADGGDPPPPRKRRSRRVPIPTSDPTAATEIPVTNVNGVDAPPPASATEVPPLASSSAPPLRRPRGRPRKHQPVIDQALQATPPPPAPDSQPPQQQEPAPQDEPPQQEMASSTSSHRDTEPEPLSEQQPGPPRKKIGRPREYHPDGTPNLERLDIRVKRLDRQLVIDRRRLAAAKSLPERMIRPRRRRLVARPDDELAEPVEELYLRTYVPCVCPSCLRLRREARPTYFRCRVKGCRVESAGFLELVEHQLDAHGTVYAMCRRVRELLYRQEHGAQPLPPETVFIGVQYLEPWRRPPAWTLTDVEIELQTLLHRLQSLRHTTPRLASRIVYIWATFKAAYEEVTRGGLSQLREQYRLAMEFYESGLVFPIGATTVQDPNATIAVGRNWMMSGEHENVDQVRSLKLIGALGKNDVESEDEELVLTSIDAAKLTTTTHKPPSPPPVAPSPRKTASASQPIGDIPKTRVNNVDEYVICL